MIFTTKVIFFSTFLYLALSRHMDFRERFLERKRLRSLKDQRVTVLNKMLKNTIILDEITHYRKNKGKSFKKARAIEKDFRRLLAMQGMKYNYKRDLFWRTWRNVPLVNGATKDIVCYRCNNLKLANDTSCHSCGTWTIEDNTPPCPFEFYSLVTDEKLCGANITQFKNTSHSCPSVIKFTDLTATCDNPIETYWRFTKMYGAEEHDGLICNKQDFCEIFTTYEITPEHVVFRIINSTNDVIYSRIMKPRKRNYICTEDCGKFNPDTKKISKSDDTPLKLNLLGRKQKRNDIFNETIMKQDLLKEINKNLTEHEGFMRENQKKREQLLKEINEIVAKRKVLLNETDGKDTKRDLNVIHNNVTERENLNDNNLVYERFDNFKKSEKLYNKNNTKNGVVNRINDNVRKTHLKENNNKKRLVNEINESKEERHEPLNERHEPLNERHEPLNESDADAYEEAVIESIDSDDAKTKELVNKMDENQSNDKYDMNDSVHLTGSEPERILNELLPMEENMSKSNWGGTKFDLVSVEVNSLHTVKSRGKNDNLGFGKLRLLRRPTSPKSNTVSEEIMSLNSIFHKPTVTPRFKLRKKENFISYEDGNEEIVYS